MAKRDDPATKGDLEDLAKSFKEGIAGLLTTDDDNDDGGPRKPPRKDKDDSGQGDDEESPLAKLFSPGWWGDRAAG